ncbi:metal ABC transporter permease [Bibersteinia trehalosi]|uniref:Chelated iron transport system membrane protein yfeD n=2 Tax=Bibersteinia trehalosi TaxID=47735 RepID=W0RBN1_BIBTR|nr:metal ABC transporter permease [Bibersteinia trehalosi]AHG86793.1 Chelated iron transport system membrane protein yfeD [Bibersteinia trehalosi USDA-ARS-USMARC-190]RRN04533.1 metal ABC transporter permease [Bibersteinia trehalosi]
MVEWLSEPFVFPFMQRALIIGILVSSVCAVLSCYLVLKGWALMGDAISHAVLPGIVIAHLLSLPLALGAFSAGIFSAVAIGYLKQHSRIKQDTVMGIVFSGMFAFGLVMFAKLDTNQHLLHILFGDILGIHDHDFWLSLGIATLVLLIILVKRRDFLLYCFDPSHARVAGLNSQLLHYGLLVLLTAMIVSAMQVVGVILVVAMLITPGMTGFVLNKRFDKMLLTAVCSAVLSAYLGILLSFHWNVATGAMIVVLQAICFVLALLYSRLKVILHENNP